MRLFFVLFMACCFFPNSIFGQEIEDVNSSKHRLLLQAGLITYGGGLVKYQYMFKEKEKSKFGLGIGVGGWYNLDLFGFLDIHYGTRYDVSFQYLRGLNGSYFDFEYGLILNQTIDADDCCSSDLGKSLFPAFGVGYNLIPNINLGYRFESLNGFVFRIGGGVPEFIKLSFGVKF